MSTTPTPVAQAILNRAVSGHWTKILFGPDSGHILSHVIRQPHKQNCDARALGPRQPTQRSPAATSTAGTNRKRMASDRQLSSSKGTLI